MTPLPLALALAVLGPSLGVAGVAAATPPASPAPVASAAATSSPGTWQPPVAPPDVARAFDAPPQNWLPGHRGVDLHAPAGTPVAAPADGVVAFVGVVAGRGVVSVDHADPAHPGATIRTTYEPVTATVDRGASVAAGDVIGTVSDASHCPGGCLHWGARRGETYVDPMSFLHARIRLWSPRLP